MSSDPPSDPQAPEPPPLAGEPSPESPVEESEEASKSPYRAMWAPLIVVPALIVIVPLLIVVLFGGVGSAEKTPEDYLRTIESGGANERQQALFGLTRRMLAHAGLDETETEADEAFDPELLIPRLRIAWERLREDEPLTRFVLAGMFTLLEDPDGVPRLMEILEFGELEDPDGQLRVQALALLGSSGDPRAIEAIRPLLGHEDPGLRAYAAIGLQKMPVELVAGDLIGALDDQDLIVRANAAIALAQLGDPGGVTVLKALLDLETYEEERKLNPKRFQGAALVSTTRLAALRALARLGRDEDLELVRALAADEPDLNLRSEAKRIEVEWGSAPEGRN